MDDTKVIDFTEYVEGILRGAEDVLQDIAICHQVVQLLRIEYNRIKQTLDDTRVVALEQDRLAQID